MFKKLFSLFCDELVEVEDIDDQIPEEGSDKAPDLGKTMSDEEFGKLTEAQQQEFFEKSVDRKEKEAAGEEPEDEESEEEEEEPSEEDEDPDVEAEEEEEPSEEEDPDAEPEEGEEAPVTEKRLRDTQKAFRTARSENAELRKRIEALEAKPAAPAAPEKPAAITLATIKPEVLQRALRENPVETMRWIADQQTKQTLAENEKKNKDAEAEISRVNFVKQSEEQAVKKFPVLKEILAMGPDGLEKLKETHRTKYEFGQKTAKYYKEFAARGDNEAFYNAAARAYVELSPKMNKELQVETKRLAEREMANKKRVLGKVSVSGNRGSVLSRNASKHTKLSEEEFMKLSPSQQMDYWDASVDSRRKK
jgi:hypothetical protein